MNHIEKINAHLEHAKEKHPYFCDRLQHSWYEAKGDGKVRQTDPNHLLEGARSRLAENIWMCDVSAFDVLTCEIYEIAEAVYNGRAEDAVEECYDAVAVLLRMAEWIQEKGCK